MRELERPIGQVWRRLRFQRFLSALVWSLVGTLAVVAVGLTAAKLTQRPIPGPEWAPFAAAGVVGLVAAALVAAFSGPSRVDAAVAIDRTFRLNERLSTAMTLPAGLVESPAGRALFDDAVKKVSELEIGPAFGPKLPRHAWLPFVPAALALAVMFVPELAQKRVLAARTDPKLEKKLVTEQTKALGKKIASQRQELEKTKFPEADKILADIQKAVDDLSKAPPARKDKAMVELNKLSDALKDRQKQLGSPDEMNRKFQQLKDMATNGPAGEFAKNLMKGDFKKAANELKELQQKLQSGKMTAAEKKELKEQLGEMAKQLNKLAKMEDRKKQLEEAKKNGGLTQKQFEQEMEKLRQQSKSLQKLAEMAKQLDKAQQALQAGDTKKAAEAMGMTEQEVSQMAKNLQEMEALDGAMADLMDAKNGMSEDMLNRLGEMGNGMGNGMGRRPGMGQGLNRGRGMGDRPEAPDQTATYTAKVKQQIGKGKALVTGTAPPNTPIKGEATINIQAEVEAAAGNAADALTNQKVPRNLEKHVRGYFSQLNKGK